MLYRVIGILESGQSLIESIDQEQNNFERVFLQILEGVLKVRKKLLLQ